MTEQVCPAADKGRRVSIDLGYTKLEGTFLELGRGYMTDEGNNPFPLTRAYVELDDGRIGEYDPVAIKFLDRG